ncbi:MAG: PEP-CTERM sorting domain-containing protein [Candidatus Latescibacteria bacterium]|nr:PEP-CTERM sorting domain-containing protein [Candidatus Latescibacterota bacterium]
MLRKSLIIVGLALSLQAAPALAFPPIDLTAGQTDVVSAVDGTIWSSNITQPTGTGVYMPFLREQHNNTEEAFNTDASPVPLDGKEGIWTHSVQWNTLATVNISGTNYYSFQLDANEPNGPTDGTKSLLSLDALKIYTASTGNLTTLTGQTLLYNLDGTSDQTVYIDTRLKQGSGTDDVTVYIPTSFFASVNGTDFMYFYAAFGGSDEAVGFSSADGFEEWRALQGPSTQVPEPTTMLLFGTGLVGLVASRAKSRRKK